MIHALVVFLVVKAPYPMPTLDHAWAGTPDADGGLTPAEG